jgi:hypothetical protein
MDPRPDRAERLPSRYRSILDLVADLERRGDRAVAARARRDALRAYTSWDERAERRLDRLELELRRTIARPASRRRLPFAAPAEPTSRAAVKDPVADGAATS